MKKFILFLFTFSFILLNANADTNVSDLLQSNLEAFPKRYRIPAAIVEKSFSNIRDNPDYLELEKHVRKNWPDDLKNLNTIAPSEVLITLYLKAAQGMPRDEYVKFGLALVPLVEEGAVPLQQFNWFLLPNSKQLREIWVDYPLDQNRETLAKEASKIFVDDEIKRQFFEDAISGEVASRHKAFVKDYYGDAPQGARDAKHPRNLPITDEPSKSAKPDESNTSGPDVNDPSTLRWFIGGMVLLGILALLFKVWKGRSAR